MRSTPTTTLRGVIASLLSLSVVSAQGKAGTHEKVGDLGISAQQMFLGTQNKLYILDKAENNPAQINGHPAWGVEWDLDTRTSRPMDVYSNTFCAGGALMGDGSWISVGGNGAFGDGNLKGDQNAEGRFARRFLTPKSDGTATWLDDPAKYMKKERWYPTVEELEDGSVIIIGGSTTGDYVNNGGTMDNPTYEFWPVRGDGALQPMPFLAECLPVNLYPLTWLLPSGKLLIQADKKAMLFDHKTGADKRLPDIPDAVRVYPASAATAVLPMTPENNYTANILFCGGANSNWTKDWPIYKNPTDTSCWSIAPDVEEKWYESTPLEKGRTMGMFTNLPDGRLFMTGGAYKGTAGYGVIGPNNTQSPFATGGTSFADEPALDSLYFNPKDKTWSPAGKASINRLYHSTSTLLPDGSVVIAGSNPNNAFQKKSDLFTFFTDTTIEYFYPDYYDKPRPKPQGLPTQLNYGGNYFNFQLSLEDLQGVWWNAHLVKVVVMRGGFSTHAMAFGQRHVELETSFTFNGCNLTMHASQLPPNPAILAPGPAMLFVVVNGVPSHAQWVNVGNGKIGQQPTSAPQTLPQATQKDIFDHVRRYFRREAATTPQERHTMDLARRHVEEKKRLHEERSTDGLWVERALARQRGQPSELLKREDARLAMAARKT